MKYMIMTYGGSSDWDALAGAGPDAMSPEQIAAHFAAMQALQEELSATGELVAAFGLSEPDRAQTVDVRTGSPVVSDGPYAETKEFLAGFGIVDVADHERAVALAARFAGVVSSRVELRPVHG
ncbi:YciI family protein [Hamadaea sp. NPDC050747]|uniref:YciI family protein n=1 Tax=Hamadaea sp. NPDC050747 TaxID=3155789 RepID=UPI0033E556DD